MIKWREIPDSEMAFCSVAFGPQYVEQQERLRASLQKRHGSSKLFFYTNELPPGARYMEDSLYGFKVQAINEARKAGYKYIFWLDTAIIVEDDARYYIERSKEFPVIAVEDSTYLADVTSQDAVTHFNIKRSWLCGKHLVGGSFYFFNFHNTLAYDVFLTWQEAEKNWIFGTQEQDATGKLQGHRWDETCMALSLYKHKLVPMPYMRSHYDQDTNPILVKKHFK